MAKTKAKKEVRSNRHVGRLPLSITAKRLPGDDSLVRAVNGLLNLAKLYYDPEFGNRHDRFADLLERGALTFSPETGFHLKGVDEHFHYTKVTETINCQHPSTRIFIDRFTDRGWQEP